MAEKKESGKESDYDFVILGGGVAGLAAGMYGARLGLKTLVLGASHGSELPVGGVITTTNVVENYPGFIKLTGTELADKIREHAESYDLVTIKEEKAERVDKMKDCFKVKTNKGEYNAKSILFATGTKWRKLPESVKGSREFENKGVVYCALCQPPGEDIVANSSLVSIDKVTPSTRVLTRDGSYQKIGGFTRRYYNGELISITPRFFTEPVKLTPNHPVLTVKVNRGKSVNYKKEPSFGELGWKEAGELSRDDCVTYPIIKETKDLDFIKLTDYLELREEGDFVIPHKETHTAIRLKNKIRLDGDFLRLFGYYLAEGSSSRHDLRFYFNKNETEYVNDVSQLIEKIIPHFEKYPLISSKKSDFEKFKVICQMMENDQHLDILGFKEILNKAFSMNGLGARKFTQEEITRSIKMKI